MSSYRPLRQPKLATTQIRHQAPKQNNIAPAAEYQNVVLTLKNGNKLVLTSDMYHGIIKEGSMYRCVLCDVDIKLGDEKVKQIHKIKPEHLKKISCYSEIPEYSENLLRLISPCNHYCTICGSLVPVAFTSRHLTNDTHKQEYIRALNRAKIYKPVLPSNKQY